MPTNPRCSGEPRVLRSFQVLSPAKELAQLCLTILWTEDLVKEMGLEHLPLKLEYVATNRGRNHHSTHLGQYNVTCRQARLL